MFSSDFAEFVNKAKEAGLEAVLRLAARSDFPRLARRIVLNQWHVVVASEHLIAGALQGCPEDLRGYFERKAEDEGGHAAVMLGDLATLSIDASLPADPNIAAMVGSQYFHIHQAETSAFLGYIGLLELNPPTVSDIEQFEDIAQFPRGSLKCARLHSAADVLHAEDLARTLDQIPEHLRAGILSNAAHSALFQTLALESLLRLPENETRAHA